MFVAVCILESPPFLFHMDYHLPDGYWKLHWMVKLRKKLHHVVCLVSDASQHQSNYGVNFSVYNPGSKVLDGFETTAGS